MKNFINFSKSILSVLSPSVTHACNTREAFLLKCWSPSGDCNHWLKHVKD
jgi:hypothetical protein